MTREQVPALVQTLGLIDLGEALTYLDEAGQVEAILVMRDVREKQSQRERRNFMKIFVTGATGVLGRPVVKALVEANHQVQALSRSPKDEALLHGLGACPVEVDLFDVAALTRVLSGTDAILHLATKFPPPARWASARPGWKTITCAGMEPVAWWRRPWRPRACGASSIPATPSSILTAEPPGLMPAPLPCSPIRCCNPPWMPKPL
jgi:hypothetical protein